MRSDKKPLGPFSSAAPKRKHFVGPRGQDQRLAERQDGSQAAGAQDLDALREKRPLPPGNNNGRCRLLLLLHLPAVRHDPGLLPLPLTHPASLPSSHAPPGGVLQRSGPRGLHGPGHQQRTARAGGLPRPVVWPLQDPRAEVGEGHSEAERPRRHGESRHRRSHGPGYRIRGVCRSDSNRHAGRRRHRPFRGDQR